VGGNRNVIERNLVTGNGEFGLIVHSTKDRNFYPATSNVIRDNVILGSGKADLALSGIGNLPTVSNATPIGRRCRGGWRCSNRAAALGSPWSAIRERCSAKWRSSRSSSAAAIGSGMNGRRGAGQPCSRRCRAAPRRRSSQRPSHSPAIRSTSVGSNDRAKLAS
jgi:hypothetical protein